MSENIMYDLYVASKNKTKIDACVNAINRYIKEINGVEAIINVFSFDIPSKVSNQPVNEETITGCENRFNGVKNLINSANSFIVSIENGLFFYDDVPDLNTKVYDVCFVIIQTPEGNVLKKESNIKTPIEPKFLLYSLESNKHLTAGHFMEKTYGEEYNSQNWHHNVKSCRDNSEVILSRKEIIEETLYNCLISKM